MRDNLSSGAAETCSHEVPRKMRKTFLALVSAIAAVGHLLVPNPFWSTQALVKTALPGLNEYRGLRSTIAVLVLCRRSRGRDLLVPALAEITATNDKYAFRNAAARALCRLQAKESTPILRAAISRGLAIPMLGDKLSQGMSYAEQQDYRGAISSAEALTCLGPSAKDAIPELAQAARSPGEDLANQAIEALQNIGTPEALAALHSVNKCARPSQ
jgi:hypothetical protein